MLSPSANGIAAGSRPRRWRGDPPQGGADGVPPLSCFRMKLSGAERDLIIGDVISDVEDGQCPAAGCPLGEIHERSCRLDLPGRDRIQDQKRRPPKRDDQSYLCRVLRGRYRAAETRLRGWGGRTRSAPGDRQGVGGASPLR
jgi:hypothetical protein